MSTLFKDLYNKKFINEFTSVFSEIQPDIDVKRFERQVFNNAWPEMELKQRMRHISLVWHNFMPDDFEQAADIMLKLIDLLRKKRRKEGSLEYMFLPDYIELFGMRDFNTSVQLMETVTTFISCEFAVRPFIIRYGDKMIKVMEGWSKHKNHHVRRLASEGSRPRLPWAIAIPALKMDPAPVLPILEQLKTDPSEYVRRSVANNLNDIAKDHPEIVRNIAIQWKGLGRETDAIIKHGCRTLLKKGDPEILSYYGLDNSNLHFDEFRILTPEVRVNDHLGFSFRLGNKGKEIKTARIEYAVFFRLKNGQLSKKVFKISERQLQPGSETEIIKKHPFKVITTRTYYPGNHQLSVIINGQEKHSESFLLLE